MDPEVDAPADGARPSLQLSRDGILEMAIAFIDEHGLAKLTMRRLGAACGSRRWRSTAMCTGAAIC